MQERFLEAATEIHEGREKHFVETLMKRRKK